MQTRIDSVAQGFAEARNPFAFLFNVIRPPVQGGPAVPAQFGDLARRFEPMAQAAARAHLESVSLAAQQVRTAFELPSRLAACRTPQEVVSTQVQFWQSVATQQYEGTQRIASAWSGFWASSDATGAFDASSAAPKRDVISFAEVAPAAVAPAVPAAAGQKASRYAAE